MTRIERSVSSISRVSGYVPGALRTKHEPGEKKTIYVTREVILARRRLTYRSS